MVGLPKWTAFFQLIQIKNLLQNQNCRMCKCETSATSNLPLNEDRVNDNMPLNERFFNLEAIPSDFTSQPFQAEAKKISISQKRPPLTEGSNTLLKMNMKKTTEHVHSSKKRVDIHKEKTKLRDNLAIVTNKDANKNANSDEILYGEMKKKKK